MIFFVTRGIIDGVKLMSWEIYREEYNKEAVKLGISQEEINKNLTYAESLIKNDLPVIFDGKHLANLTGISHEYIYKIANTPKSGYRKFVIPKKNGGKRIINEPLPNLKILQTWILREILEKQAVSIFAKAYKKGVSIKENVRFHKNQKKVLRLDIEDFFSEVKQRKVLNIFLSFGYSMEVSVLLAKLCTLNKKLPQGAPTSSYLSNLALKNFDADIAKYCKKKKIRYTRYADDMTFSGDFKEKKLINRVERMLTFYNLKLNKKKTNLMRPHNRQLVTGITVNEKIQVRASVRKDIRKTIFFIRKYGLDNHLKFIGEKKAKDWYLKSLISKVGYCLFINPDDEELQSYYDYLIAYEE